MAFGTGKSFKYFAAHEIATGLVPEKARALPMYHAPTGCDNVSSFAGHGKKTAWAVWTVLQELTYALLNLSFASSAVTEDVLSCIERFVILIYDRTSTINDSDETRRKLLKEQQC